MKPVRTSLTRTPRLLGMAVLLAVASPLVLAQDAGWYGGFNLGESRVDMQDDSVTTTLQQNGYTTNFITGDDKDLAFKVLGGYSFNRYFALEGSYFDLGEFGLTANVAQQMTALRGTGKVKGLALDLVGTLPITDRFSAFARVGANYARVSEGFSGGLASQSLEGRRDRDTNAKYGLGVQYDVSDAFALRAEMERYHLDDTTAIEDDVDMISLGFVFRFGDRTPPPAPVAAAPAPAPAPAPARPTPPPAPPAPVRMTVSADALFDFDSAEMRNAGRQELDNLIEDLRDLNYDVVVVTGHTDRIGAPDYNLELSQRRANVVRDYLIGSGIPAGDVTARGINGSDPVTTLAQCPEGPVTAALIACLQPDRRVDVEVSGTR